jgi:hypothetical protein
MREISYEEGLRQLAGGPHDFRDELRLAILSRASYESPQAIDRDRRRLLPADWSLLDDPDDRAIDRNATSGFVAMTFVDERKRHLVIAFRGSDTLNDWSGPNLALSADGSILEELGVAAQTERVERQLGELQQAFLPDWHVQFEQALEYTRRVVQKYQPLGYRIEVTGHGSGGSMAQLASATFALPGAAFDPLGAKNVAQSGGYRAWAMRHGFDPEAVFDTGWQTYRNTFVSFLVNNSEVSHETGPHLGRTRGITGLGGRQGFADHAKYVAGIVGGGIGETLDGIPLLGRAAKSLPEVAARSVEWGQRLEKAARGADLGEKHEMDRLIRVLEEAVREGELQRWGLRDPLLRQSLEATRRLEAALGRPFDESSRKLAYGAWLAARHEGLSRVDHVVLNAATPDLRAGVFAFAVQGDPRDPAHHRARFGTDEALARPLDETVRQVALLDTAWKAQDMRAPDMRQETPAFGAPVRRPA